MKIAQIAPLAESVPPQFYGGTERVVSFLTEELVHQGHDVTLFASGDSRTSATLVACCNHGLRSLPGVQDFSPYLLLMLDEVRRCAAEFDVLHFHVDLLHLPLVRDIAHRTVTTLHGRLDVPGHAQLYAAFADIPVVSVSKQQRQPVPGAGWAGCVYHGLPTDLLPFAPGRRDGYLAFLGRICPEKRPDRAIEVAARSGRKLRIAAKVDAVDATYWEKTIAPLVRNNPDIEYVGEIGESDKASFLGEASALLFPIDWPEPFGLVMIEAMACGTPVIAWRMGSVPEVVEHGRTGFIVDSIDQAVAAVDRLTTLSPAVIRAVFERRFTVQRMAQDYLTIYRRLQVQDRYGMGVVVDAHAKTTLNGGVKTRPIPTGE